MSVPNNQQIIDKIAEDKKERTTVVCQETHLFSGPIPHPDNFAQYEKILPGSADRILKMAEDQSTHRHFLEKTVIINEQKMAGRGQILGFVIIIICVIGSFILIFFDKKDSGFITLIISFIGLIGSLIYGNRQKQKDIEKKDEKLKEVIKDRSSNADAVDGEIIE